MSWILPAHILNILWDDVYPRIAPLIWNNKITNYQATRLSGTSFASQDAVEILRKGLTEIRNIHGGSNAYTSEFIDRLCLLERYLAHPSYPNWEGHAAGSCGNKSHPIFSLYPTHQPVPIRFLPGDGYDFILSDEGLELALPPDPDLSQAGDILEVCRKYSYREIATTPILTPGLVKNLAQYLEQAPSNLTAQEARAAARAAFSTGSNQTAGFPSRIGYSEEDLFSRYEGVVDWSSEDWEAIRRFINLVLSGPDREACGRTADETVDSAAVIETEGGIEPTIPGTTISAFSQGQRESSFANEIPIPTIDLTAYTFLLRGSRRWQVTADLYSGIMHHFPRVIAELWRESKEQFPGRYTERYTNPAVYAEGKLFDARSIFEERLEAWLPEHSRMKFRTDQPGIREFEVIIDTEGFTLPACPDLPDMNHMFEEWTAGQAVNPVFSPTLRTE